MQFKIKNISFFIFGAVKVATSSIVPPPKNAGLVVFGFELKLIKFSVLLFLSFVGFVLILVFVSMEFLLLFQFMMKSDVKTEI